VVAHQDELFLLIPRSLLRGGFIQLGIFRKYEEILISSKYAGFWKRADFEITSSQL